MVITHVYLTEKKKLKNPLSDNEKCNIQSYHGPIESINLERQTKNHIALINSFLEHNIVLSEIWYGKFLNAVKEVRTTFIVKSECGNVFWYKYESLSPGGMQNKVYICGDEFKLTSWLELSREERHLILQKYNL